MSEEITPTNNSYRLQNILLILIILASGTFAVYQTVFSNGLIQGVSDGTYAWEPILEDELGQLVYITEFPDDSNRLALVQQRGRIHIIENGELLSEPFLDISDLGIPTGWEQGLLGLAFHPDYAENGYFYINYTQLENEAMVLARYQVSEDDPDRANPNSREILLITDQPNDNHNGGMIEFGPDDYLYVGLGDGGGASDSRQYGQNTSNIYATIIRLDVVVDNDEKLYEIPTDNPFLDDDSEDNDLIWMYGLRNPWRFSFDMQTGDMFIADVGEAQYEEINYVPAGEGAGWNFGWGHYEGYDIFNDREPLNDITFPIAVYEHDQGCSVTGGYVYRGSELPELDGSYFYGDFCTGIIWRLIQQEDGEWLNEQFFETDFQITSFGQDSHGEIYVIDRHTTAYKLVREN